MACKKEKLYPLPEIEIYKPASMFIYGLGDTIPIHVSISHQYKMNYALLSLRDKNGFPFSPSRQIGINSDHIELKTYMVIQNAMPEGGVNYIQLSIFDEKNQKNNFYLPVNINSVPKQLRYAIFINGGDNNGSRVKAITSAGSVTDLFSVDDAGYGVMAIASSSRLMYYTEGTGKRLTAYDLEHKNKLWTIAETGNSVFVQFKSLYSDDTTAYVYRGQGFIDGYNEDKQVVFHSQKYEHGSFTHFTRFGRFLAGGFKPFGSGLTQLILFNIPGATEFRNISFKGEIMYLSAYDSQRLLLFLKQDGRLKLYHYDLQLNNIVFLMELPFADASQITGTGKDHYFVVHQDELWWVRPALNSAVNFLTIAGLKSAAYDPLDNYLFVAAGSQLSIYRLPETTALYKHTDTGEITNLNLLYNR
ncbi:hypothetical protein MASR1M74_02550 [Lentimicrobium sp.]